MAKVIKLKTTKPGFSATPSTYNKRSASGGQFRGGYKTEKFAKEESYKQHDKASYNKPDNRSQDNRSRGNGSSGSKDKKDFFFPCSILNSLVARLLRLYMRLVLMLTWQLLLLVLYNQAEYLNVLQLCIS